jgi:acyl-coenzyme A thioesterase PaaI-like protein
LSPSPPAPFRHEPDPENPGWFVYELGGPERYNRTVLGPLLIRAEGADHCRVRMRPLPHHANNAGRYHGGITLGLTDCALFAALHHLRGLPVAGAVTVDLQCQFIGAGDVTRPLDCVVELLRETRRLAFLRGLVVQDDDLVASFTATAKKANLPR